MKVVNISHELTSQTSTFERKKKTNPRANIEMPTNIQIVREKGLRRDKNLGLSAGMGLAKVRKSLS